MAGGATEQSEEAAKALRDLQLHQQSNTDGPENGSEPVEAKKKKKKKKKSGMHEEVSSGSASLNDTHEAATTVGVMEDDSVNEGKRDNGTLDGSTDVAKKNKRKSKSKKKEPLVQTDPPSIPVADLFPSEDFPEGEIQHYKEDNLWRETSEEKRNQERLEKPIYNAVRQAAEVHRQVRKYIRNYVKPGIKMIDLWSHSTALHRSRTNSRLTVPIYPKLFQTINITETGNFPDDLIYLFRWMALHFAKRPFNHFISTVSRFTSFIPPAFKSHIISSDYLNPQFSLHTNLTHSIPSITNAHYNHRWVSSDTGFTLHGEAEERDLSGGYSSDEHIYKSDEDPEVMNEGSGFNKVLFITKDLHSLPIEEARAALDDCGFTPSPNLVQKLLHRLQYDGKAAFRVFQWAGSQPEYSHTVSAYHTMISILGVHGKFDKGWGLIRKMHENAMVTRQTLMIMVKSYAAAHDAQKAIRTFHAMDKFKLAADYDDFLCLLRALCRNMFVEEAEELIHFNKKCYPLETKSFNVILYGWCNIFVDVYQVKRLWEEMSNLCITPDASSYTTVICCYSKAGKFYDVVRLYDEMKKKGFTPNLKVYNAVIYVLSKERCIKEALNLFNRIREMGFHPNAITYTYLIYLLCRTWNPEEAYRYLDEMIMEGFVPTIEIYHAFFRFVENEGAICKLFDKIYKTGCAPTIETYIMSIRRCCSWSDYQSAFKLWNDMEKHCFAANSSIHSLLLNGFLLNGKPEEACKCYREMKANGFSLEPKIDSIFESWNVGRKYSSFQQQWKLSEESLERKRRKYTATVHRRGGGIITKPEK